MPEVARIVAELQVVLDGMQQAQSVTAAAGAGAEKVRARTERNKLLGVAGGMGKVRERLKRIQQMQASVATSVDGAVDAVQQVSGDVSPADLVSTLSQVVQQIGGASTATAVVVKELDEVKAQLTEVLRGGQPSRFLALVDEIKHVLLQAITSLGRAKQRADESIVEARQTGGGDGGYAITSPTALPKLGPGGALSAGTGRGSGPQRPGGRPYPCRTGRGGSEEVEKCTIPEVQRT